jgi:cell division protein FtsQ
LATSVETAERMPVPPLEPPRRRGWRSGWTLVVLCAALVVATGVAVSRSGVFALSSLRIRGTHHLSVSRVQELAGVTPSTNVLWLSTGATERRILVDPWVGSVQVSRVLPSTLAITVRERTPVAVAADGSGETFLLAGDGVVLQPAPAGTLLPAVPPVAGHLVPGQRVPAGPALRVAAAFGPASARLVASVSAGEHGVDVELRTGVRVIFGEASQEVAKAQALAAVLAWAEAQGITPAYVDVSAPSAPALLPVGAVTATPVPYASAAPGTPAPGPTPRLAVTP